MRTLTLVLAAAAIGALPLSAMAEPTLRNVEVDVDVAAIKDAKAAQYWGTLNKDIEAAILQRVAATDDEKAPKLTVDVDAVRLSEDFAKGANPSEAEIKAHVIQASDNSAYDTKVFDLSVGVDSAVLLMPQGTDIAVLTWETPMLYSAMVDAFADAVVQRLE